MEPVDNPLTSYAGSHADQVVAVLYYLAYESCVDAKRVTLEGIEYNPGSTRINDSDELTLVSHIEGIETKQFAGSADFFPYWKGVLEQAHTHTGSIRNFV